MRILIFNPDENGHNFVFLKALVPALRDLGCEIIIALTKRGFDSTEFRAHMVPVAGQFQADCSLTPALGRRTRIAEIASAVRRNSAEHLLVPNAEPILAMLGLDSVLGRRSIPAGLTSEFTLIRADFAYPPATLKQRFWYWAKERCINAIPDATISLIDPVAYGNIQRRRSRLAERVRLLPELLDNIPPLGKDDARCRLGLPAQGRILACTGRLDLRKGVGLLLQAFAKAELRADDRLLLAGELHHSVVHLFKAEIGAMVRDGRIIVLNRYLSDEELNWVLCAADVVAATYLANHSAPSAIINKAAVIGRPVLASRFGWSDYMVPEFGLGTLTDPSNLRILSRDIAIALEQSGLFVRSSRSLRLGEYLSPSNFAASWTSEIVGRLGHRAPECKRWDWVLGESAQ